MLHRSRWVRDRGERMSISTWKWVAYFQDQRDITTLYKQVEETLEERTATGGQGGPCRLEMHAERG